LTNIFFLPLKNKHQKRDFFPPLKSIGTLVKKKQSPFEFWPNLGVKQLLQGKVLNMKPWFCRYRNFSFLTTHCPLKIFLMVKNREF
jgi:hypothetical protein